MSEPFSLTEPIAFGGDGRTRVLLFAMNLTLTAGENASAVSAEAEDAVLFHYPLLVEYVGAVPNFPWLTGVVVRLNDLNSNALRPAGWTSADAAGLPIFPGLVRYDEVFEQGLIAHAIRFTVQNSRHAYVAPARHYASDSTNVNLPPMGMRVRLKASFDISGFSPAMQVILRAFKKYGMIVADNGSNWYFSGAPDPRWNDDELSTLKAIKGSNFEVVQMGTIITH
jgi:hypothetical protein